LPSYDVHQHLWPELLLSALSRRTQPPRLRGAELELVDGRYDVDLDDHRLERRLALLDRDGIDVACISLQPTLGCEPYEELVAAYHEGMEEVVAVSGGRLRALACGECRRGFAGACVSAEAVLDGVDALAAQLSDAGQFLFVHPGVPAQARPGAPPWWSVVVDYTAQMEAAFLAWIARGRQEVAVVFALLGGGAPFQLERLAVRGEAPAVPENVFLETASYGRQAIEFCVASLGPQHLVYGSDTPVTDSRPTLHALAAVGDAVVATVCEENPARLFA
jgi:hypothetical protein